ncbi:UNVERIFIED_CONTAM: hypothetical protein PYX00_006962 [Menopon gallinae]|uniref:Class II aldolase/adducin N-terminal domain-containing protein n=1 Tax=Menopon gallinae TaxID=328185 RepID=A0AAW2HH65_9NEOP
MADTQTHANGIENGLEEEDLTKLRPADIDADIKEMERRKRVEMIMNSKMFREELERIIEMQMKDGNGPAGLLQQISDLMGIQAGKLHTTHMFRGSNCVTPINDIRGVDSKAYPKGEKHLRCKLASVFRLMDLYGWSQGIHNLITVRLNQDEETFLVNPYGMLYNEITASSLIQVDMQGNVVKPGTTNFTVNTQVFLLHSSIHASRPDIKCVIHIHTPSVLAVSSLKCGLLPLCQEALVIGEVSQHPFVSGIFEPEEREKIIRNLGPTNKVLLLHNHGALCCGETVEEAFFNVYNTVLACETQIKLMPIGVENLVLVNDETRKQVYDAAHKAPESDGDKKAKHFRVGELEFEALIRMLDNAGFRTGYIYRHPLVKGEVPKPKNDVEVPPAVSSLGYLIEEEKLYSQGNWKKYVDGRNRLDRTKWLNSPNVYQKVEMLETGTPDPKKINKWVDQNSEEWVADNSPTHSSTPVKIDSALQFVPKNTNPKEFKKLQQQIKENRLADKITSGPQSHILEGVTWEEAKKLQDANITQTGDQVILVGAASKGIIQRNYQHNALVYKTPYAKNPFDSVSDQEIEDYKRLIERKQRGDTDYEESQSESEAVSSRQEQLRHIKSPLMSPQSATSETEEESRDEPRVLRIETKTAPQPIQAEVVLSDDIDTPDVCISSVLESLTNFNLQQEEPLQSCIARISNLKQMPVLVNVSTFDGRLVKSASDPCNLSIFEEESSYDDCRLEFSDTDSSVRLKQNIKQRKKLLHSAKMKFLGVQDHAHQDSNPSPGSHVRALISEIRDKISEVMSPEACREMPLVRLPVENRTLWNELGRTDCEESSEDRKGAGEEVSKEIFDVDYEQTDVDSEIIKTLLVEIVREVEAPKDVVLYTPENDIEPCSNAESTETEWYYNKTILMPHNTETVLEVENQGGNIAKQSDTGIETDFTSEKDIVEYAKSSEELENTTLNKTSETDSSLLKTSSGRTSVDVDTSLAFKTEESEEESAEQRKPEKLPGIPESPEFTSVDTEDAPVTSSSKNSSPEIVGECKNDPDECNNNETEEKTGKKRRKKGKKTRITVKKEVRNDSEEPVKSEIKLTIKNSNSFASESYEFEIQDDTNTSGEVSRSSQGESYEVYELAKQCDCPAQQDLQMLQSEVNTSIVKLQSIEQYFEDEINTMNVGEEGTFTCNYDEPEEVPTKDGFVPINTAAIVLESEIPEVSCNVEIPPEEQPLDEPKPKSSTISDVTDFIMYDEESPTDSTADMSVAEDEASSEDKKKRPNRTFNILIATPDRKEIFINYDEKASSSFVSDEEMKCNSYINTDDVNQDFAETPEWFSSHGKEPENEAFDTAGDSNPTCPCNYNQAPTGNSLAIIEEVEETECGP